MSDPSHLSDDLSTWPANAHALLGVPHEVDRSAARRAYHQLIRRFKPEQYPEHFRRIREAYDEVLQNVELYERFAIRQREASESDESPKTSEAVGEIASSDVETIAPMRVVVEDPLQPWREGIEGKLSDLYARLYKQVKDERDNTLLYAQLTWLLRVAPELHPKVSPNDWLVGGLVNAPSQGDTLAELYRRELRCDDAETLGDRAHRLFKISGAGRWLGAIARIRWQRAAQFDRFDIIRKDMEAYDSTLGIFGDRHLTWDLKSTAIRSLWLFSDPAVTDYAQEVLRKVEEDFGRDPQFYEMLAWLDASRDLAEAWQRARRTTIDVRLLTMLIEVDTSEFGELRSPFLQFLARTSLRDLYQLIERLAMESVLLFFQFDRLVSEAEAAESHDELVEWPEPLLARLAYEFIQRNIEQIESRDGNIVLLDFCLSNSASPAEVIASLEKQPYGREPLIAGLIGQWRERPTHMLTYRARRMIQG